MATEKFDMIVDGQPSHLQDVYKTVNEHIHLADGSILSVQASKRHCCFPQTDYGPYLEVEVGFMGGAKAPDSWKEYAEGSFHRAWLFTYVPVAIVKELIESRGGEV